MKVFYVLALTLVIFSCKTETPVKEVSMKDDVYFLADDKLEGRETGTPAEKESAKYLAERFKNMGLEAKGTDGFLQYFTFKPKTHPHGEATFVDGKKDSTITGVNVVAYIDNKAENTIIIGAHYDHLGHGIEGTLHRGEKNVIHNGADDNASGVAVMLNLAGKLKEKNTNNNYLFISFSGEEMGLLGSNYWVKNPTIDTKKVNYMINMDMVGRLNEERAIAVYGVGTSPKFSQVLFANNTDFKLAEKESGVGPSDHTSFYLADMPVLHFFTGQHEDYHKPTDDANKLNYEGMEDISEYLMAIIADLDDDGKLAFRKTKNESDNTPEFKVTLGVVPDYLYDGKGMRLDGVTEEKPAHGAGMKKGDIVIKVGEFEITDMMSYMKCLSKFEKGQKTMVEVERDGEIVELEVTW
ncbi:MAG: M28 family peptidase [Flavobacteriaceae bacterium]|nr:M28 family peptidase [Flavobacteriaceae bacterium]